MKSRKLILAGIAVLISISIKGTEGYIYNSEDVKTTAELKYDKLSYIPTISREEEAHTEEYLHYKGRPRHEEKSKPVIAVKDGDSTKKVQNSKIQDSSNQHRILYDYLMVEKNRNSVSDTAAKLHEGDLHNACVYYASEALRRIGENIPLPTCNTAQLKAELTRRGFKICYDMTQLRPGDLCFTTCESGTQKSTHVYVFMSWETEGKYDYAYVCDNQSYDFGTPYHTRNINFATSKKDAFYFFMYKPN